MFHHVSRMAILCLVWSQPLIPIAQTFRPLTIGDTVPPVTGLPSFKGKLTILDFWGQYCSSCIKALNDIDSLQGVFNERLQVVSVSDFKEKDAMARALKKYIHREGFKLPMLLANDTLSKLFPHKIVSHVVWIAASGEIKAITGAEYVTRENIQQMLDGQEVEWPVKQDLASFDYTAPLLGMGQPDIPNPAFLYYSAFTGYIDGIAPPSGIFIDSASQCSFGCYYNMGLINLCQLSVDGQAGADRGLFKLQVKDTSRYIKPAGVQYAEWRQNNAYCYYIRLPIGMDRKTVRNIIKQDLARWLVIMGIQVKKQAGKPSSGYIISESKFQN